MNPVCISVPPGFQTQVNVIPTFAKRRVGIPFIPLQCCYSTKNILSLNATWYKAAFAPSVVIEEYTRPVKLVENGKDVEKDALSDCKRCPTPFSKK